MSRPEAGGEILLDNGRRAARVRWIMTGSAVCCAGFLYWAGHVLRSYGLSPGDGGILLPLSERWPMAALLAALGLLPFLGMILYGEVYLARIERRGGRLHLSTLSFFGTKTRMVQTAAVSAVNFHDWALEPGSSLSTPWLTLRIDGRSLPLIADLAAEYVNRPALEALARRDPLGGS